MLDTAYVFVDNANVFGGAQRVARSLNPPEPWPAVRVYYKNLFRLVEHGYDVKGRLMVGSVTPGTEELWGYAEAAGYDTKLLRKVQRDDGRMGEQAVDEALQLKMLEVVLDREPGSLVLVTGDGAPSATGSSFLDQVKRALNRGWAIDVWSWGVQLSLRFRELAQQSAHFVQVKFLDQYFDAVTFCKGGDYLVAGVKLDANERIVARLPDLAP